MSVANSKQRIIRKTVYSGRVGMKMSVHGPFAWSLSTGGDGDAETELREVMADYY